MMMRTFTEKLGKLLYRDGPMLVVSSLFAGIYIQNMGGLLA